jgi:hypothetical protein
VVPLADLPSTLGAFSRGVIDGRAVLKLLVNCT